ncbi:MAG: hypothetical protein MK172_07260 [Verrucomicrobiales bacterium]|nr:hypothetical protein [Verrucomicrobiales bacterium]
MRKHILSLIALGLTFTTTAKSGTVIFDNFSGTFSQVHAWNGPVPAGTGFVAVGTTTYTRAQLEQLANGSGHGFMVFGRDVLEENFIQFGESITFGFNGFDGYFQGVAQGDSGDAAFVGKPIVLVAGNSSTIAESSGIMVIVSPDNFAADNPIFSANIGPDSGQFVSGGPGGTNTINANLPAFTMNFRMFDVIPEPEISILALFSAALLFLRRQRHC